MGIGIGMFVLLLVLAAIFATKKTQDSESQENEGEILQAKPRVVASTTGR
jgi:hypothetical protein